MRFRRRFRGAMRRKRTVAWIPGLTGFNTSAPAQARVLTLSAIGASNTYGGAIILVNDADLSMHGGEDAVMTRIRGTLWFYGMTYDAGGPQGSWGRVVIAQQDIDPSGNVMAVEFTTTAGLGRDEIMYSQDVMVTSVSTPGSSAAGTETSTLPLVARVDIDVKARRRLQSDQVPVLWFQTCKSGAAVPQSVAYAGGLRMLLARPR